MCSTFNGTVKIDLNHNQGANIYSFRCLIHANFKFMFMFLYKSNYTTCTCMFLKHLTMDLELTGSSTSSYTFSVCHSTLVQV